MEIKPNTYYRTRNERKACVEFKHPAREHNCWVGYIEGSSDIHSWQLQGQYTATHYIHDNDLIDEWQDAPAVGSSAWANSLPVGTKVRWHTWNKHEHAIRTQDGWEFSCHGLAPPERYNHPAGWLLYTEPTIRPWRHDEVPDNCWLRYKGDDLVLRMLITGVTSTKVAFRDIADNHITQTFAELLTHREHSTDGGKTWLPCGVKE